jgi:predicted dehydrogenase
MTKVRVGVVGVGYLGKFHAEKYAGMKDVELVGVVDLNSDRAHKIAQRCQTQAFTDVQHLIGAVDAVSIAVPTPEHYVVARRFLSSDVDVLIEKPITTTLAQADELIQLAEEHKRIIQVGHLERFNPAVVAIKDIVKRPLFIESHRLSIFRDRCTDVSVVLDLMIHDIDIILHIVSDELDMIRAAGVPVTSGNVDIANARLEFRGGCVANVTASRISMKNERKIRLFQKDAYISVDFANQNITVVRKGDPSNDAQGLIPGMQIDQLSFEGGDALKDETEAFIQAVRTRQDPAVTGQMGRDALKTALNIHNQIDSAIQRIQ